MAQLMIGKEMVRMVTRKPAKEVLNGMRVALKKNQTMPTPDIEG